GNPVKEMFLLAALYLPLAFFLWFSFGSALMWLPGRLAELALTGIWPDLFAGIVQLGQQFEVQTEIRMSRMVEGQVALLNTVINPMIYAWGMALIFGLVLATPLSGKRRLVQLLIGYLAVAVVTAFGVFWETWRDLAFLLGPEAAQAVAERGPPLTLIALLYQLGYLMLPAITPVAAWILMNRPFLEQLVFSRRR
ncbi:MAG: exosortase H-associated membrane protein, partial [Wenzhouxiangellaceae bacterium]